MASMKPFSSPETFNERHIGPTSDEQAKMLQLLGYDSLDALTNTVVPESIQFDRELTLPASLTEREAIERAKGVAGKNEVFRSLIGMGYYGTHALRHPSKYSRKSRLVHSIHTIPSRDRSRAS